MHCDEHVGSWQPLTLETARRLIDKWSREMPELETEYAKPSKLADVKLRPTGKTMPNRPRSPSRPPPAKKTKKGRKKQVGVYEVDFEEGEEEEDPEIEDEIHEPAKAPQKRKKNRTGNEKRKKRNEKLKAEAEAKPANEEADEAKEEADVEFAKANSKLDQELAKLRGGSDKRLGSKGAEALETVKSLFQQSGEAQKGSQSTAAAEGGKSVADIIASRVQTKNDALKLSKKAPAAEVAESGKLDIRDFLQAIKAAVARDGDEGLEGSASSSLDGPLTSRKSAVRRIAIEKPGSLLASGLDGFREDLVQVSDEVDENTRLQPICCSWFRSIFLPNNPQMDKWDRREIQTYTRLLDLGLKGDNVGLLDMLMQRLKAKVLSCSDGHWDSAQYLEILPSTKAGGILSMGEEEFVRKVNAGEIRLADLLGKIRAGSSGGARGAGS